MESPIFADSLHNSDPDELRDHVLFTLLVPAARMAVRFGIPLREVKRAIELAYYRETRNTGMTMREIVEVMSVSMRKVGMLSNDLKTAFSRPDSEYGISRSIVSLLLAGPMTRARIAQALSGFEDDEVHGALDALVAERRIAESSDRTPRYALAASDQRLVATPWVARVDALGHMMRTVSDVVHGRFFDGDERAFARTVSFRASEGMVTKLKALYDDRVFPTTTELESEAGDDAVQMSLAIMWGPDEVD